MSFDPFVKEKMLGKIDKSYETKQGSNCASNHNWWGKTINYHLVPRLVSFCENTRRHFNDTIQVSTSVGQRVLEIVMWEISVIRDYPVIWLNPELEEESNAIIEERIRLMGIQDLLNNIHGMQVRVVEGKNSLIDYQQRQAKAQMVISQAKARASEACRQKEQKLKVIQLDMTPTKIAIAKYDEVIAKNRHMAVQARSRCQVIRVDILRIEASISKCTLIFKLASLSQSLFQTLNRLRLYRNEMNRQIQTYDNTMYKKLTFIARVRYFSSNKWNRMNNHGIRMNDHHQTAKREHSEAIDLAVVKLEQNRDFTRYLLGHSDWKTESELISKVAFQIQTISEANSLIDKLDQHILKVHTFFYSIYAEIGKLNNAQTIELGKVEERKMEIKSPIPECDKLKLFKEKLWEIEYTISAECNKLEFFRNKVARNFTNNLTSN